MPETHLAFEFFFPNEVSFLSDVSDVFGEYEESKYDDFVVVPALCLS